MSNIALHSTLNNSETVRDRGFGSKGPPIGNDLRAIKWLRDRWRHVTLKGQTRDPNTLRVQYLENSWRCYLATTANYYLVCCETCEAVRSSIATAWLLVSESDSTCCTSRACRLAPTKMLHSDGRGCGDFLLCLRPSCALLSHQFWSTDWTNAEILSKTMSARCQAKRNSATRRANKFQICGIQDSLR